MALPSLTTPKYTIKVASGETIRFRPFTVGEQKILLTISDSMGENPDKDSYRSVIGVINDLLKVCIDNYDPKKLSITDIEWIFVNIRAKSIGETVKLAPKCSNAECQKEFPLNIDLESDIDIKRDSSEVATNRVKVTDKIFLDLQPISIHFLLDPRFDEITSGESKDMILLFQHIIRGVWDGENYIDFAGESFDEQKRFISSLSMETVTHINRFLENQPKVVCSKDWKCPKCGHENHFKTEGVLNFFA